jgi:hypothetical protein
VRDCSGLAGTKGGIIVLSRIEFRLHVALSACRRGASWARSGSFSEFDAQSFE